MRGAEFAGIDGATPTIGRAAARRLGASGVLLAVSLGLGAAPPPAVAKPAACPDGSFVVDGSPFTTGTQTPVQARVVLAARQVALEGVCSGTVAARVVAKKRGTRVTAKFPACAGLFAKATLKAKIGAPACDTMTGALLVKKAAPRKRPFAASRQPAAVALATTLRSADAQARLANENFPYLIRPAAEALNPEVVALIALGAAAVDPLLAEFDGIAGLPDDIPLALFAYVLERIGDPRALPVLVDWLARNLFASVLVAPDFVTHAIKVLDGQEGLDPVTFTYDIDEQLDTIAQARPAPAAAQAAAAVAARATGTFDDRNKCERTIFVTGLDADGQQQTARISYKTLHLDLQQQIDTAPDEATRRALESRQQRHRATDEDFYGTTDYRAIGDVSETSNCGGAVTERLLNAVAEERGLTIRLGEGNTDADTIRDIARLFGTVVEGTEIDRFTVISHDREGGRSAHVEIPITDGAGSVEVYSKDNQGRPRIHTVSKAEAINAWEPVQQRYNFRPFANYAQTTPTFYRIDPSRIVSITIDSSACPCDFAGGGTIPLTFTQPVEATVADRVVTVAGLIGAAGVANGTLRVNGSAQGLMVDAAGFSSEVVLRSGDNQIRVAVDGVDGARGCAERTIHSSTPRTSISATLTWNLDQADLDLYVTQPDGETSYYSNKTTMIGGELDVDNTSGRGPENYYLSAAEGDMVPPGTYAIRVHYYADHRDGPETHTRAATWRVVLLVNEGTPAERRKFFSGTLGTASSLNDSPGSDGPDWATAESLTIPPP